MGKDLTNLGYPAGSIWLERLRFAARCTACSDHIRGAAIYLRGVGQWHPDCAPGKCSRCGERAAHGASCPTRSEADRQLHEAVRGERWGQALAMALADYRQARRAAVGLILTTPPTSLNRAAAVQAALDARQRLRAARSRLARSTAPAVSPMSAWSRS